MILKRLFRWQYWRWRSKYWRQRAMLAEKKLEAEMWRDRERSDIFASAAMLGSRGMVGIPARTAPASIKQSQRAVLTPADPWGELTWADKQEFELYWKPNAEGAGITLRQAQQDFLREIASRRQLNDDPFAN